MKREFTNETLEEFLKQSADNLRMKAPDKVWQNLSKELNKRRRRLVVGIGAFLLITSAVGYYSVFQQPKQAGILTQQPNQEQNTTAKKIAEQIPSSNLILPQHKKTSLTAESLIKKTTTQVFGKKQTDMAGTPTAEPVSATQNADLSNNNLINENNFTPTVVDSYTEFDNKEPANNTNRQQTRINESEILPLSIESVVNAYKLRSKKGKLETQFYFVPTISYRKLTENKTYLRALAQSNTPSNYPAFNSSVNNNVTHKPDVGFEIGVAAKYPLSSKLKLRTGIQFNVNRYDVKAFSATVSVATIALNNRSGPDSLNTISSYSNINGYKSNWLQNLSFQVSAPVGIELALGNTDKVQFGVATSIQPTYIIGDRAYLITTDYKNYAQVPWLVRRWNVNTAFETFVIYNSGKTRWQVGPQVRYQLLSSFINEYPVKENLFDFGLKVGVSLNKN